MGTWKCQRDTVFHKSASAVFESPHNMDACLPRNILEPLVEEASLCELVFSFMSGLKSGKAQVLEFKPSLEAISAFIAVTTNLTT